jgi:hypothetical protein
MSATEGQDQSFFELPDYEEKEFSPVDGHQYIEIFVHEVSKPY